MPFAASSRQSEPPCAGWFAGAAGQADAVLDAGDRADRGELAVDTGDEQHAVLSTGVDRQGHVHRREDDAIVERNEQQGAGHQGHGLIVEVVNCCW